MYITKSRIHQQRKQLIVEFNELKIEFKQASNADDLHEIMDRMHLVKTKLNQLGVNNV